MNCNKPAFESWEQAEKAVGLLIDNRHFQKFKNCRIIPYICPECEEIHIGHAVKGRTRRERRREDKLQTLIKRYLT